MKNRLLLSLALIMALGQNVLAYDFSAVAPTGQTLYYNLSGSNATVTDPGNHDYNGWSGYTQPTGALTIPSTVSYNGNSYSVTSIGLYAFYGCSGLTSVTIPNSVTSIGNNAFNECSGLTSITIPNSVIIIGNRAFYKCSGLTAIVVQSGNRYYDSRNNCNAIIMTFSNTLIQGCQNTIIPNTVTSIKNDAFSGHSGLTSITIPNSVTSIGNAAFSDCSGLTSVTIPNSVTSIGGQAFLSCSGLTSITIPNSVTSIGAGAFCDCRGLTSVTISSSVTSIEYGVFSNCSGLTSVTIPNSVTSIGQSAFRNCRGLTSVTVLCAVPPVLGDDVFYNVTTTIPVYVPCGSDSAYCAAAGWSGFSNIQGQYDNDSTETITACNSYTWHGRTFTESTDTATYRTTNAAGCDSIVRLHLTVNSCNTFTTDGDWNDGARWSTGEVPGNGDDVLVVADAIIPDGYTAHVNTISIEGGSITIADGGQLMAANSVPVSVQKGIDAATWHALAAPVDDNDVAPLTTGSYDLFAYDEEHGTWLNQKNHGDFALNRGYGCVYRRTASATVSFDGNTSVGNIGGRTLSWLCADGGLKGFNLVGNPYPHNIYFGTGLLPTGCAAGYYTLQCDGTWRVAANGSIAVGQAVLLQATGDDASVSFVDDNAAPAAKSAAAGLTFTVSNGRHEDVAIATFGEGAGLRKVGHLNAEAPMLYIPQEDADYAIAMVGNDVEEFYLHMRTPLRGRYTLNVAGSVAGMQIIDLQTGRTIATPYSFEGSGTSRFLVRMRPYDGDGPFAFLNGGQVVIAGEGTLQAYDVMGRLLFSCEVSNQMSIPSSKFPAAGVYLLRLGEKSQKIVIK